MTDIIKYREIIHDTAVYAAIPRSHAKMIIDHFLSCLAQEMAKGNAVKVTGWGIFRPSATRVKRLNKMFPTVRFKPSRHLKLYLQRARGGTQLPSDERP